jgi:hypothetical protein
MSTIEERRLELEQLEQNLRRVEAIDQSLKDLRADVARFTEKQKRLAAFGDEHIPVPNPGAGTERHPLGPFSLQPFYSEMTGSELADGLRPQVDHLKEEIRRLERERTELLKTSKG